MPITIDPDCKNVPCDAFSTCRTGACFPADTSCTGSRCTQPGEAPDGGTDEAGAIIPDAGGDGANDSGGDGATDAAKDGAKDGAMDAAMDAAGDAEGGAGPVPYCTNMILHCRTGASSDVACSTTANTCCDAQGLTANCNSAGVCCGIARHASA